MIPSIIGGIGKLFTGQGLDFLIDKEGNEKEGEILPALGALLPMALKALPLILGGAGAAASIAHTDDVVLTSHTPHFHGARMVPNC